MQKNGQYVGVNDEYVPDNEKYVDNNLNNEFKNDMHDVYKGAKDFVTNKDNQEKIKQVGRKGLKIFKGIGIGYLIYFGIVFLLIIVGFVFTLVMISKSHKDFEDTRNNIINSSKDIFEDTDNKNNEMIDSISKSMFNSGLESYKGTQSKMMVGILLDNISTNLKKYQNHVITVTYGTFSSSNANEIITLKKQLNEDTKYEVIFDYDATGYIYAVTILD